MKVSTPIYSAREGTVVEIKQDSNERGSTREYIKKANFIKIKHSDNQYTLYAHLQRNSVEVKLGEKVLESQFIALSGNTGFSDSPHLHFEVYKLENNERTSLPFKFSTHKGAIGNLSKIGSYRAVTNLSPCP